jgi:hypothetical protein
MNAGRNHLLATIRSTSRIQRFRMIECAINYAAGALFGVLLILTLIKMGWIPT